MNGVPLGGMFDLEDDDFWERDEPNFPGFSRIPEFKDDKELDSYLNQFPLMSTEEQENEAFAAMKALVEECPAEERALEFKKSGNMAYQLGTKKRLREAVIYYSKGIDVQCNDEALNAVLFTNRAMCQIKLGNYGYAVRDCLEATKRNKTHVKAYFHGSRAAKMLGKYDFAIGFASTGLGLSTVTDKETVALTKLRDESQELYVKDVAKKAEKEKREQKRKEERERIEKAITSRGITLGTDFDADLLNSLPEDAVVYLDDNSALHWPCFVFYPQYMQSDFIKDFHEDTSVYDMLCNILPSPQRVVTEHAQWDEHKAYAADNVEVYVQRETKNKDEPQYKKVKNLKMRLGTVLCSKKVIVNGIPGLFVVPIQSPDNYLDTFKRENHI